MQIVKLWKTVRQNGGITVSPVSGDYSDSVRLIANEGKILTNGNVKTFCIDVDSAEGWKEIDAPEEDPFAEYGDKEVSV